MNIKPTRHLPSISWQMLREHKAIAKIATLAFLPQLLVVPSPSDPFSWVSFLTVCLGSVVNVFSYGICIVFINGLIDKRKLTFGESWSFVWSEYFALLIFGFVSGIVFSALYLPGFWMGLGVVLLSAWVILSIWVLPDLVLNQASVLQALRYSIQRVKATLLPFFWSYACLYVCVIGLMVLTVWVQQWIDRMSLEEMLTQMTQHEGLYMGVGICIGIPVVIASLWVMVLQVVMFRYFTDPTEESISQNGGNE